MAIRIVSGTAMYLYGMTPKEMEVMEKAYKSLGNLPHDTPLYKFPTNIETGGNLTMKPQAYTAYVAALQSIWSIDGKV